MMTMTMTMTMTIMNNGDNDDDHAADVQDVQDVQVVQDVHIYIYAPMVLPSSPCGCGWGGSPGKEFRVDRREGVELIDVGL